MASWVSVREMLPEVRKKVLVRAFEEGKKPQYFEDYLDKYGCWEIGFDHVITHWTDLPQTKCWYCGADQNG
jgi:hypothetical protein